MKLLKFIEGFLNLTVKGMSKAKPKKKKKVVKKPLQVAEEAQIYQKPEHTVTKTILVQQTSNKEFYRNEIDLKYKIEVGQIGYHTPQTMTLSGHGTGWTELGLEAMVKLVSDGNGMDIHFKEQSVRINYGDLYELYILLAQYYKIGGLGFKKVKK